MADVYGFDKESVKRIAKAVAEVLGRRPDLMRPDPKKPPVDFFLMYGKANADLTAPGMLSVSIWEGPQGEETDTEYDVDAYVYSFGNIVSGADVLVGKTRFGYVAVMAGCAAP